MDGTTCDTSPMSVLPAPTRASRLARCRPSAREVRAEAARQRHVVDHVAVALARRTILTSTSLAIAAPRAHRSTMARTRASSAPSSARTLNSHDARSGMMFTAWPPFVTKPCTRTPSRKWTRCPSTRRNVSRHAVSALAPSCGASAACDGRPVEVDREPDATRARDARARRDRTGGTSSPRRRRRTRRPRSSDLAAAALLGRRAEQDHLAADASRRPSAAARKAPTPRRGDQVVPARVTDAPGARRTRRGSRRAARRFFRRARATRSASRRRRARRRCPATRTSSAIHADGLVLFEAQLGVRVDARARRASEARRASTASSMARATILREGSLDHR